MTKATIRWVKAKCPMCGADYHYIEGGYKPLTCNKFDCLYKYIHRPQYKDKENKEGGDANFQQKIDKARQELGDKL